MSTEIELKLRDYLKRTTLELHQAQQRLRDLSASSNEPIAIVGMGCRFPGGVTDPESFWRLLDTGADVITEVPPERWDVDAWYDPDPDAPGKMSTRWGGFLDSRDIEEFDPGFFGITPGEAKGIDPQLRLLMETTWEALEHAALKPASLMGQNAGVYMGICGTEYLARAMRDPSTYDAYSLLGSAHATAIGRISYWLGLKGPNMAIDTACSSSLVTTHLACQALRQGTVNLALAGGVNTILEPASTVYCSRLRAMSPTGRCHTFSAAADGYVRSEGAGVLVLERLSDARKNGHRVLAVIRGSAVNQDGRSNGQTAPNGPSQEALIREALAQGQIAPSSIGYLECHGTGTPLGDPIEVQAAAAALGEGRSADQPLVLGSAKSNIGHTEGAAGVAGLIKAVLTLQRERIPRTLHVGTLNPHIPWSELPVTVAREAVEWPRNGTPRRAGVSSFGMGGTNAHVVLEEAPPEGATTATMATRGAELVVLSAKSPGALDETAERLRVHLEAHPEPSLGDVAFSLATTRTHHEHRLSLAVKSREELLEALANVAGGTLPSGGARDEVRSGKLAFLFTGQGAQALGMGRDLYAAWPVFREALDAAFAAVDAHLPRKLRDVMWAEAGSPDAALLHQTEYTQPALFAIEVALAALWRSWGVRPDYLAGHSIGELAAAHVAGVFSLEDAARLVVARGRLMQALPAGGAMVAIAAPEASVREALAAHGSKVSIGAVNGPSSLVISGDEASVLAVAESFAKQGVRTKRLEVSHAFHSALMDPMLDAFRKVAESIRYHAPELAVISNVTGALAKGELATADYWVRHVREAVRFGSGIESLHREGVRRFLEVGPQGTLVGLVPACLPESEQERVRLVKSLAKDKAESLTMLEALGRLHVLGVGVDWAAVFPGGGRGVDLPTYAWQRQRYWLEAKESRSGETTGHPLLGVRVSAAGGNVVYESVLSRLEGGWLYGHCVKGKALVPGAGLAEMARAAGEHYFAQAGVEVTGVAFQAPLMLPERGGQRVQVVLELEGDGAQASIYSQAASARPEET